MAKDGKNHVMDVYMGKITTNSQLENNISEIMMYIHLDSLQWMKRRKNAWDLAHLILN